MNPEDLTHTIKCQKRLQYYKLENREELDKDDSKIYFHKCRA